jgi:hypothetical protein
LVFLLQICFSRLWFFFFRFVLFFKFLVFLLVQKCFLDQFFGFRFYFVPQIFGFFFFFLLLIFL